MQREQINNLANRPVSVPTSDTKNLQPTMKKFKPIFVFVLSFLLAIELFLFFNINASFFTIIPASLGFALIVSLLRKSTIHLYKLIFDENYKPKKRRHKYRHSHTNRHKHGHRRHHRSRSGSSIPAEV